jgi:hypothetical protein
MVRALRHRGATDAATAFMRRARPRGVQHVAGGDLQGEVSLLSYPEDLGV